MNIQNLLGQLSNSQNPMNMIMSMLPSQNQKTIFSNLMNKNDDTERAQALADLCNKHGITKEQLEEALRIK